MNLLVKMLDSKDLEGLRENFHRLDVDGTGMISAVELKRAISESNTNINEQEIDNIISEVDYQGNKFINYTEFLAATISVKKFLTDDKLMALFK